MEKHDIVIVGAGPGGLRAAELLAEAGRDVLVLEKNRELRDKVCAGGITGWCRDLNIVPENCFEKEFYYTIFTTGELTRKMKFNYPFVTTYDRARFGEHQREQIEKNQGEIRTEAKVTKVSVAEKKIEVNKKEIGYNYLIGADGPLSIVRRTLGLRYDPINCYQYTTDESMDLDLEMEWGFCARKFGVAAYYVFPHSEYSIIGIGHLPRKYGGTELPNKERFLTYWKDRGVRLKPETYEAGPIGTRYDGFSFNNIFLIGDAGGFANKVTGEGVYEALVTAGIVSQAIIDPQWNYEPELQRILKEKEKYVLLLDYLKYFNLIPFWEYKFMDLAADFLATIVTNPLGKTLAKKFLLKIS
jgi:Dehydrogenases (flavoproteins)